MMLKMENDAPKNDAHAEGGDAEVRQVRTGVIRADDIEAGMFLAVHSGLKIESSQVLSSGVMVTSQHEVCDHIKGVPVAVLAVNLPFILGALIPSNAAKLFDVRDVTFTRVSNSYVRAFQVIGGQAPAQQPERPEQPEQPNERQAEPGQIVTRFDDGDGSTAEVGA